MNKGQMTKVNDNAELARVASELATAKLKLDEERRKREEDVNQRLGSIEEKIVKGQGKILEQIAEVKLTYATATRLDGLDGEVTRKFEYIERRLNDQGRLIYMAMGGLVVLQAASALAVHFWK